jgi:hypothetical protein
VEPRFTNASHHEQIGSRTNFPKKKKPVRVTNGVSSNEHASRQQRLATSWQYRRESVSCCVTYAQYTSLLELAVRSLEFNCVLWFFIYIINLLKPTGYWMHQQVTYFDNCTLCPYCIYVLYLSENKQRLVPFTSDFYNRDEKCLQRGTDWAFR